MVAAESDALSRIRRRQHPARRSGRDRRRRARSARLAAVDSVVSTLPDGYATLVGEGFRPLSTGERQRIALARAFLRDAPLVVLDEPTANLDPASARIVAEAVDRLRLGRTVLLIAHDRELAELADRTITIAEWPDRRGRRRMSRTLRRLLALAAMPRRRLALSIALAAMTVLFGVGLLATSGYLISRAAEQPPILSLTVTIVIVRFFGLARPLLRYLDRLALARSRAAGRSVRSGAGSTPGSSRSPRRSSSASAAAISSAGWSVTWTRSRASTCAASARRRPRSSSPLVTSSRSRHGSFPSPGAILAVGLVIAGLGVPLLAERLSRSTRASGGSTTEAR